ncbi:MAG: type II toxin-antitoxin system RelE/ParE family toxin [Methylomicrobium sp.]
MACYRIEVKQSARKALLSLPNEAIAAISRAIDQLSESPHPKGSKKLVGSEHTYRIRVGNYRIVYTVFNAILTIEIIKIGHRKDIYR